MENILTDKNEKVTVGLRLASMLVDHFAMTMIAMVIVMPGFAINMINVFSLSHDPSTFGIGWMVFLFAFGFSAYFNKDIFNGRSPAKRILKLQVIDNKTNQAANSLKCLVRNLTIPLWPMEVIFVLINPKRRLGDKIAGTRIEYIDTPENTKVNWSKFILALLIGVGFSILFTLPFLLIDSNWGEEKVAYIESSFDQQKSQEANELFKTKLNGLIREADFRVYNQIKDDKRKYVSGILYFNNENDYENFEESEKRIAELLISIFPLDSHVCFLKFVYKRSGHMATRQKLYNSEKK